jgi:hypothetical protein
MSFIAQVLEKAVRCEDARLANEVIYEHRQQVTDRYGQAANYEVVLEGRSDGYLRDHGPKLAYYARSKGMSVAHCDPIFMSLFHDAKLHIVPAPAFYAVLQQHLGHDDAAFATVCAAWEKTGRPAAALPGGGEPSS